MDRMHVGRELRGLSNMIRRHFAFSSHKMEIEAVTGNNGWIIGYLADNAHQEIFQKDIEEHFQITRSTVSRVLSLMEQKGLILRKAVERDARLKRIVLTDRALELCDIMRRESRHMESLLMQGFSQEEIEIFLSYLLRMKANISAPQEGR
jgi:DNA-binding MarR family transcriptional regulator